jgi:hypothetical protein
MGHELVNLIAGFTLYCSFTCYKRYKLHIVQNYKMLIFFIMQDFETCIQRL